MVKILWSFNTKDWFRKIKKFNDVRVAQDLGINKITEFSKKLNIYENPEEILSISLGSTETTLLKLTTAYCSFVNGGKLVSPILIDRIQDSEGTTIFNSEKVVQIAARFHF